MKKLFISIISALAITAGAAEIPSWKITEVTGNNKIAIGYIYHTSAIGTQVGAKTEKFVTGLRFVCSTKAAAMPADPLITIYWNTMIGNMPQYTEIHLDKKLFEGDPAIRWEQDGPLLYRSMYVSQPLIKSMKTSNSISFSWLGTDAVRRSTMFDLKTFNAHLGEFSALCKIEL